MFLSPPTPPPAPHRSRRHLLPEHLQAYDTGSTGGVSSSLLETIQVPRNLKLLKDRLPGPQYPDEGDSAPSWQNDATPDRGTGQSVSNEPQAPDAGLPAVAHGRVGGAVAAVRSPLPGGPYGAAMSPAPPRGAPARIPASAAASHVSGHSSLS